VIQDRLDKIEAKLKQSNSIKESDKIELLSLFETLKAEMDDLSETHREQAESIVGFAELSTHEATRSEKQPTLLNLSTEGLILSVQEFEVSHPRLVGIINSFCTMLANSGI
jgi:hypothetical protein